MSYNKEFFESYKRYLEEPSVRVAHNSMMWKFKNFCSGLKNINVIDLGCGSCEYHQYGGWDEYVGVDVNPRPNERGTKTLTADYNNINGTKLIKEIETKFNFQPNVFVSLFSTECCLPAAERYKLYKSMFDTTMFGCVAGFFYKGKEYQEVVEEVNGLKSYQTIEHPKAWVNEVFTEFRCHKAVPSKLFGPNVIEVWKFLVANG